MLNGAAGGSLIAPGVGTVIGAGIGAVSSALGQSKQNHANRREAKHQRDWQKGMSDTAHRREVADLRAAGLNPILSATGGTGASTGSSQLPQIGNSAKAALQGAQGALSASSARAQAIINSNAAKQSQDIQENWDRNKDIYVPAVTGKQHGLSDKASGALGVATTARDAARAAAEKNRRRPVGTPKTAKEKRKPDPDWPKPTDYINTKGYILK